MSLDSGQDRLNMFNISVEDTGHHPHNVVVQIKDCVKNCLKSEPSSLDQLRTHLAHHLSRPEIMGAMYRFMWVDKVGRSYFIIIATNLEDGLGRGKPVLAWAVRQKMKMSLKDLCSATIKNNIQTSDDVTTLGLPTSLQSDIYQLFQT